MKQEIVRDPVCGMEFTPSQAATRTEWEDRTYFFCCQACQATFEEDPRRFIRREDDQK